MNGYGTGSVHQMVRALGVGTIKAKGHSAPSIVVFTPAAVHHGQEGFQNLSEGDDVHYRLFPENIAGVSFAMDVWRPNRV
jgi:hypothetical protein